MGLPEEIKMIRKKGFYTQIEFAEHIGVSYTTVNRWENGKMDPNVSAMKRLKAYCDVLNIKFDNVEKAWLDRTFKDGEKEKNE